MGNSWAWLTDGSPQEFHDGWCALINGGLWEVGKQALQGDPHAVVALSALAEATVRCADAFRDRLRWWLGRYAAAAELTETLMERLRSFTAQCLQNAPSLTIYLQPPLSHVTLQGVGVQGNSGYIVRVVLERWATDRTDQDKSLLPHPAVWLLPQDADFQDGLASVQAWWQNTPLPSAHITWRIARLDQQPSLALKGNSLSALLAVGLWLLLDNAPVDPSITVSAAVRPDGQLLPVSSVEEKAQQRHRADPPLRHLLIAAAQQVSGLEHCPPDFLQRVHTVAEAREFFLVHAQPFQTVRDHTHRRVAYLRFFDRTISWDAYEEPTVRVSESGERAELWAWFNTRLRSGQRVQCLLTAPSGMGKTTALRFCAYRLCTDPALRSLVPIVLDATQWSALFFNTPLKALPAILEHLYRPLVDPAPDYDHWRAWLLQGRVVLLVDQAEQVAHLWDFRDHLRSVLREFDRLHLLIAVRSEWLSWFSDLNLPLVQLEPLSEQKAQSLCTRFAAALGLSSPPSLPSLGGCPLLLIAALCQSPLTAFGQGQLMVQLAEWLLSRCGDLPLPDARVLRVLAEVTFALPDKAAWRDREFYEALQKVTGATPTADALWVALKRCPLLSFHAESVAFSHTLLAETLRALALASRCTDGTLPPSVQQYLTPLRALLLASLLPRHTAPAFWAWLQRKMESDPKGWAEAVAQCLNERTDYPHQTVNLLLSRWFEAFQKGVNERDGWDKAIKALPPNVVNNFVFPDAQQKLTSRSLSDRKSAAHLLALVAHTVKIPSALVELLADAFMDEYGFTFLGALKTLFAHPLQHEPLCHFVSTVTKCLDSESVLQRRRAIRAIDQLSEASVLTDALKAEITDRLEELVRSDLDPKVRSMAQKTLSRLLT
ncbi:hypothetical protein HRbin17_02831 [bacterium HR17]|uniref:NACHT domain-containing protein n=1 Tax=Candidatus Fervidibacter japonicus TaxID=2035412 RepID=A0A2H5XGI9_9BACT|nr:hypothetical protein HRbin17_02831 [bacterium HR17]